MTAATGGPVARDLAGVVPGGGRGVPRFAPPAPVGVEPEEVHPDTFVHAALRQSRRQGRRVTVTVKIDGTWHPVRADQLQDGVDALAAAFVHAGVTRGDRVAILAENRLEWLACDLGGQAAGAVVVPIYASTTPEGVEQVLADSEAVVVVCSTPGQAAKVAAVRDRCPSLCHLVLMEGDADLAVTLADFVAAATSADVATVAERIRSLRPEDPLTIIYTSGTTGVPKGVVLTHANVTGSLRALVQVVAVSEDDQIISFLPWAHVYERVQGLFAALMFGVTVSIASDLNDIGGDLLAVRPTAMNGVPRLYEKMEEAVMAQLRAAGGRRAALGLRAIGDAVAAAKARRSGRRVPLGLRIRVSIWDRVVLNKIRDGMGGRARLFTSGGGPINLATLEFFDALGIAVVEGYGLTETTGGFTVNDPDSPRFGTVGRPTPGHQVRIAPDGEILVRGPGVMQGYFNNPQATGEVLQDGWFATGDIGEVDHDGHLRITDRKKDLIVTAGGKNIAPGPIETAIAQHPLVERAVVIGDRRKYVVALVVPNFPVLRRWAEQHGVTETASSDLARNPKVQELYTGIAVRASANLARYETIKKVAVLPRDLAEARGELTPTLKVKRRKVMEDFADVIDGLYA